MNTYHSNCDNCGTALNDTSGRRKYCSEACRRDANNRRKVEIRAELRAKAEIRESKPRITAADIVRIQVAIENETGDVLSYTSVCGMIEQGEIDPMKYLKGRKKV